jgi:hypothetical protein
MKVLILILWLAVGTLGAPRVVAIKTESTEAEGWVLRTILRPELRDLPDAAVQKRINEELRRAFVPGPVRVANDVGVYREERGFLVGRLDQR